MYIITQQVFSPSVPPMAPSAVGAAQHQTVSSIPGLNSLDARSTLSQTVTIKTSPDIAVYPPAEHQREKDMTDVVTWAAPGA